MLVAAEKAVALTAGKPKEILQQDETLLLALTRLIEIVGEAAGRVTPQGRARCPNLPWPQVVGMRNRVVHAYFDIDLEILWKTIQTSLPELIAQIKPVLASWPGG